MVDRRNAILMIVAVTLGIGGCALAGTTPAVSSGQELQTHDPEWPQFFDISWQPGERHGTPIVSGRIRSKYGRRGTHVQLLVEGLDAQGKVTSQRLTWLGWDVPPLESTYFEIPVQKSANYRVSVFAFE